MYMCVCVRLEIPLLTVTQAVNPSTVLFVCRYRAQQEERREMLPDLTEGLSAAAVLAVVSKPIHVDIDIHMGMHIYIHRVNPKSYAYIHTY